MAEYIDRNELLRIERLLDTDVLRASKTASTIYDQMMYDIEHIPAADVAPVKYGKWIFMGQRFYDGEFVNIFCCSCCDIPSSKESKRCPNCGAYMRGDNNE